MASKLLNYLKNIRTQIETKRYEENCLLGQSKLEANQGKNDGALCVLAYERFDHDCVLAGSSYALIRDNAIKRNSLEKSSYSLVKKREVQNENIISKCR